jgi:hypothetical protein
MRFPLIPRSELPLVQRPLADNYARGRRSSIAHIGASAAGVPALARRA